ncbi:MAG TPA: fumarylacetoacetase [Flavobacteriales bacterium]|nr:fumarylacetoacetase [Flavobacteriales bacterium]
MIRANDPNLRSWVPVPENSDFPIQNLPLGVICINEHHHVATRIGDHVLDLAVLNKSGLLGVDFVQQIFEQDSINACMALGKEMMRDLRNRISRLLDDKHNDLRKDVDLRESCLLPISQVEVCMPLKVGNYTDFYSSIEHATNVGTMLRDPANALSPNWKHIPIGYHGRASSIILSGTPVKRPKGQTKAADQDAPSFGPCQQLDFELEMAFVTCRSNPLGTPVSIDEAEDYIFGMVLFNDWSARDIQSWEYVPLGPFLAKSFASSVSAWVVSMDALEPFRVEGPVQDPKPLPYLQFKGTHNYDIELEVLLETPRFNAARIVHSNYKYMYWNMVQQLTHQASNGCNIQVGDLYASGTISGPIRDSYGSMMELTWRGTEPLKLPNNTERKFIQDNDTVIMKAYAKNEKVRIGFGEVITTILPA